MGPQPHLFNNSDILRGFADINFQLSSRSISRSNILPVPHLPHGFEEFGFPVLILKVVSMFPGIEDHDRNARLCKIRLMVVNLSNQQGLSNGLPNQRRPTGTHNRPGDLRQLFAEPVKITEILLNGFSEVSLRSASALGSHVCPEYGMKNVSREVKRQRTFQRSEAGEIVFLSLLFELLQYRIRTLYICSVMLAMVQLHDFAGNVRF